MYLAEYRIPLTKLKGVGPGTAALFSKLGIDHILDLLMFLPRSYEDRRLRVGFRQAAEEGRETIATGLVTGHERIGRDRAHLKILVSDQAGDILSLLCFNREFLKTRFPAGSAVHVVGSVQKRYDELQCGAFEIFPAGPDQPDPPGLGQVLPVYPLTAGLHQALVRRTAAQALAMADSLQEEIPPEIRDKFRLGTWPETLRKIHRPASPEEAEEGRKSAAWRELWFLTGGVLLEREHRRSLGRAGISFPSGWAHQAEAALPFQLTEGQRRAVAEVHADLESGQPMARLLQGDVGSGKTLVAFLSCLPLLEAGKQAAFLAPTELLARQHAENAAKILEPVGVRLGLLTASVSEKEKALLAEGIRSGTVSLVFGTHALLNPDVSWKDLSLVIVDEQQRFGVRQREALLDRGKGVHLLMMSATPIPRTLALTAFGDLDVSVLPGLPPGRKPITTYLSRLDHLQRVWDFLKKELSAGRQAYVIYPLIEESEKKQLTDLMSAVDKVRQALAPFSVGVVHGKLSDDDKVQSMQVFSQGKTSVLCATSVVEVGVDVPNASCMVIVHSEVFGLSALHQLRGRVGRGQYPGSCFLVYSGNLTDIARERLKVLRETTDGFRIAEEDLKLRGPGEILGNRQAGFLKLRAADLTRDAPFLIQTRETQMRLLEIDPEGPWKQLLREQTLFAGER